MKTSFHESIIAELNLFLQKEREKYDDRECLKIDLHCHDCESSKPDEMLGRILNVPETWLSTDTLLSILQKNGCTAFTVTNHNNATSCWKLLDAGFDILPGAEFTVNIPDMGTRIHVLAYGFTPDQEGKLRKYRTNLYRFQEYAAGHDIPTVWAHPLFHYQKRGGMSTELFNKLSLVFSYFETMNGQRDSWQNMLVHRWISSLTPERIDENARRFGIDPGAYTRDPYRKILTGGSDEHMGVFTGQTGVRLHVPDLKKRVKSHTTAELALEALRAGRTAVYGNHHDSEKMTLAFIDYFCQLGLNMQDPGLFRILFHKGEMRDKVLALAITNGFLELRRHRLTSTFLDTFHRCILGENPGFIKKLLVPKVYKPVFKEAINIAKTAKASADRRPLLYRDSVERIFDKLTDLVIERLTEKFRDVPVSDDFELSRAIMEFDVPAHLRSLFESESINIKEKEPRGKKKKGRISQIIKSTQMKRSASIGTMLDGLPFPILGSFVLAAATFTSAKVLYNTRPMLDDFARELGTMRHPRRMLWLTDTLEDRNGVAFVLGNILDEIRKRNLPIDLLVCSSTLNSGKNLIVVPPKTEVTVPFYRQQPIRIPNIIQLHNIFKENEYDRIMCSTEGFMGIAALFLKEAYTVPAFFYLHTDWVTFGKKVLGLEKAAQSRIRRLLRAFYKQFDGLFVLNSDQEVWLKSRKMGIPANRIHTTAHWVDDRFTPKAADKEKVFGIEGNPPVLLFTGRLSREKGATELPHVYRHVKKELPDARVVFAGSGPAEKTLRKEIPDAVFLGWVDQDRLPEIYSAADILVLPSIFDTFGCVVLEAMSCGTVVVAYNSKGPKDIITHGENGFLAAGRKELCGCTLEFLKDPGRHEIMSKNALKRAAEYSAGTIMDKLVHDISLFGEEDL